MDFIDYVRALSSRAVASKEMIQTEEATKTAMVMPFIQILGYNVFDPAEVTPEFTADVGIKKGEKVDYAVFKDGKPILIFECKKCGADLNISHASQLYRYFGVTDVRFGVLTNGLVYRFYTDLDQTNKMDEKPFFEFNLVDFKEQDVEELKKFAKASFNLDQIQITAEELKYTREIQNQLSRWMNEPCEGLVRLVAADLMQGKRFTPAVLEQFTAITKRAFKQLIADRINERLRVAMTPDAAPDEPVTEDDKAEEAGPKIVTTPQEWEGFYIVRSILRDLVPAERVLIKDAQSYCSVLLDNNNRKPICRLRFNNPERLVLALIRGKDEEKIVIASPDEIHNHADSLKETLQSYLTE